LWYWAKLTLVSTARQSTREFSNKELCARAGPYAVLKWNELEYERRHPGELARWSAEPNLEDFAIEVGTRMEARQGLCPVVAFAADISRAPGSYCGPEGHS
jgi:hypothetical protein